MTTTPIRSRINFKRINQLACAAAGVPVSQRAHIWGSTMLDYKHRCVSIRDLDRYTHVKNFTILVQFIGAEPFTIQASPQDIFLD